MLVWMPTAALKLSSTQFFYGLVDDTFMDTVSDRLDLFVIIFVVYEEGLFIYYRPISKLKFSILCFLIAEDKYPEHNASSEFYTWREINIHENKHTVPEFPSNEKWVQFFINDSLHKHRRQAFQLVKKIEQESAIFNYV
eukprot:snap_masked-scaffold_3-processed-gene-10.10-mRNA-1 protein AED:1.00 eAED:1.00 QI:0/0/0/0/1/1/2/0/138